MLVIRNPQFAELRKAAVQNFEERLIEHAERYFPDVCEQLEPAVRSAVEESLDLARSFGFVREREICKFLNLQFRFGREFHRDPQCAWAQPLLSSSLPGPPKMDRLYASALRHEAEARGYFASIGDDSE